MKATVQWNAKNWILQRVFLASEFLTDNNLVSLPYPSYSPDLATTQFFLFSKMNTQLKGRVFDRNITTFMPESKRDT